jgi:ubiquitin-conjugating enzyme E2 G2
LTNTFSQQRLFLLFAYNFVLSTLQSRPDISMASSTAHRRLLQEYRALTNNPPEGITAGPVSEDDLLYWEALIQGPEGTPFEGGVFPAELKFPKDYPLAPPSMRFLGEVWHPNGGLLSLPLYCLGSTCGGLWFAVVDALGGDLSGHRVCTDLFTVYPSGLVCISILHPPGDDPNHYEHASERWSPIQSVEKILISVMSMLAEPNDESPANVEAAKMWREQRSAYEKRVRDSVRRMLGL